MDYAPDDEAFDALVDLDGAELPPTEAELLQRSFEPVDPTAVVQAIRAAVDLAENYLIAGTGTTEERLAVYVELTDALAPQNGSLPLVRRNLGKRLAPDLTGGINLAGRWWLPGRAKNVRGWDKRGLQSQVSRIALADVVNTETGEVRPPTAQEAVERMWELVEVATGRNRVLRTHGIDEDEYAQVTFEDTIDTRKAQPKRVADTD